MVSISRLNSIVSSEIYVEILGEKKMIFLSLLTGSRAISIR